jgi:hypothetical protein
MADYYPLISRAIAGLDPSAPGESRRALYERARSALIAQLRSVQPPLTESEITRERLSLEEAVRKVESEAAQRARGLAGRPAPAAGPAGRGDALVRGRGRAAEPPAAPAVAVPSPPPFATPPPERPNLERPRLFPLREDAGGRPPRNLRADAQRAEAQRVGAAPPSTPLRFDPNDPLAPTPPPAPAAEPPGVRGFRDVTADVDDLGRAATRANRAARRTFANVPSPTPEFERLEPNMEDRGADAPVYGYDEPDEELDAPKPSRFQMPRPGKKAKEAKAEKPAKIAKPKPPRRAAAPFPLKSAIAIGAVMILIGAAILWGPRAYSSLRAMLRSSPAVVEAPKDGAAAPRPKIADRVGQPGDQIAPVAQRVVLYDEDPAEPNGKQYVGSVVWRTEPVKGAGGASDISVRADIEIPDRKFRMTMSFRRNTDTSLPASHTAELTFALPQDFAGGGVSNVPGILMKSNEQARGTPLAGLAVKVTDGFFLVGLSNVEADRARNLQLLKERSWFDIPLVYTNQRRAIIAIEKGSPGERAFNDAFAKWGE